MIKNPTSSPRTVSDNSTRLPLLFIGHGSPMNAIADNAYTRALNRLGAELPRPKAILCISAHWMTEGSWITEMAFPRTIHDFYGFPPQLFKVQYPAPGGPEFSRRIRECIDQPMIRPDTQNWGLDHGTWAVLRHLYPKADIPVLQLSLPLQNPTEYHVQLGKQLSRFRDEGVLIVGSGNLVHNLERLRWEANAKPYDWAIEFDEWLKDRLMEGNFAAVLKEYHLTEAGRLSVPTMEHYLPLHYILGAADEKDCLKFEYEELQNGSISMRSFSLGRV